VGLGLAKRGSLASDDMLKTGLTSMGWFEGAAYFPVND
jgi:hypothetical protein